MGNREMGSQGDVLAMGGGTSHPHPPVCTLWDGAGGLFLGISWGSECQVLIVLSQLLTLETLDEPPRVAGPCCPFPGMPQEFLSLSQGICDHSRAAGGGEPAPAHTCPGEPKRA